MKNAKFFLFVILLLSGPVAQAERSELRTETKRGSFSISPLYGQTWHQLISSEGKSIMFEGQHYGLEASLMLFEPLSIFVETRMTDATNEKFSSEKLTGQGYSVGFKLAAASWLDISVGFGQERDKVSSSSLKYQVTSETLVAGLTAHVYEISESFGFFLQMNYRRGYAPASKNGNESNNSGVNATEISLGFRWSPSVSFTYTK